jgi:hypothetical protein
VVQRLAREKRRLILLLDQFEEFLILHEPTARERFLALLRGLDKTPVAGLRLVLVLRSEYEAQIPEAGLPRLRQGENWFKLGAFTAPAARTFLKDSGLELAPAAFDRLLAGAAALEATRGLFRPIVLNLLGLVIARHSVQLPTDLAPERVIQSYLQESISATEIRADAPRILMPMISEAGTKRPLEETALAAETRLPLGRVRHCLLRLAEAGLVRPLGQQQLVWEITHDFNRHTDRPAAWPAASALVAASIAICDARARSRLVRDGSGGRMALARVEHTGGNPSTERAGLHRFR